MKSFYISIHKPNEKNKSNGKKIIKKNHSCQQFNVNNHD